MEVSQLIDRCKNGDSEALGMLYTTYSKPLRKVCRRYLSDEQTVSDVLHDSFVVIFSSLNKLRDNRKAEKWMKSITRNVTLKYLDCQKVHQVISIKDSENSEVFVDESQPEENELSLGEMVSLIDKLPESSKQVFRLAVLKGMSHQEIADLLNIEPHSSSSQLARSKMMLRKMIRQYWAVILLFLIPISFFLLKKEDPVVNEDKQVVVNQNETQNIQPTEPEQHPLIVEQTKLKTSVAVTDTALMVNNVENIIVVADTTILLTAQENEMISDTLCDNQLRDTVQGIIHKTDIPQYDFTDNFPEKNIVNENNEHQWAIRFAYAESFGSQLGKVSSLASEEKNRGVSDSPNFYQYTKHHYTPITLTLTAHYNFTKRLGIETGLSYIQLTSELYSETEGITQTVHYLGIPIKGIYTMCVGKRMILYDGLGLTMGIPVHSQLNAEAATNIMGEKVPWLWSVGTGLGIQYNLTRHIGIFAEPSIQYYIPRQKGLETYCTEHPFAFSVPLGLKIIW